MSQHGYEFYFTIDGEMVTLPITPGELSIKIGTNNKVVSLINGGDINVLKMPSLVEISFDARFPMRKYPYSREFRNFEDYHHLFTNAMVDKTPVIFTVVRKTPNGTGTWGTTRKVAIEEFTTEESADEGDDVIATFKLKEYKEYGVKTITINTKPDSTSTSETPRDDGSSGKKESKNYTVKSGDCLWNIAKAHYGNGSKWTIIYNANKTVIEKTADKYRNGKGSQNGHWIYPGTVLTIPPQ